MIDKEKFLITGFSGFVSKHFLDFLENNNIDAEILGIDINDNITFNYKNFSAINCSFQKVDLLNKDAVNKVITEFKPNYILHLASYSSVALSWKLPVESFTNNTNIFLNLIETVRLSGIDCRILSIGSSEEYGNVSESKVYLAEEHVLNPISPYAVARVSQEMLSKIYTNSYGMDIIMTRSFNHIGTHQKDIFVIPSFIKKMIILKNDTNPVKELTTGDTSIIRDFVDVRSVVEAYYLLFKKGKKGEVYNICNGKGVSLAEVISTISSILDIQVIQKTDRNLIRPNDNRVIIGSNEKLMKDTGWINKYSLEDSLKDIVAYYQSKN
jgi:GDP-4-dehydro-6-deoxy-D-mannose reductase